MTTDYTGHYTISQYPTREREGAPDNTKISSFTERDYKSSVQRERSQKREYGCWSVAIVSEAILGAVNLVLLLLRSEIIEI